MFWPTTANCAEPWADRALTITDGLELWLDASRQISAAQASNQLLPKDGQPIDVWSDGSGRGRHLRQPVPTARPAYSIVGSDPVIRFDGNSFLRLTELKTEFPALTIFIVAAPLSNAGDFRGLLAFNAPNERDYESGLTVDLGPAASAELDYFNIEGKGFGGARNLMKTVSRFGLLHIVEVHLQSSKAAAQLIIDGITAGERPREIKPISMAEITVGGRYYTNGPGAQQPRGFLHGHIAEVLVFSRELNNEETVAIRTYLDAKHSRLKQTLASSLRGTPLVRVTDPPPVQMLVPGFSVRELPVELLNVNNVRIRPDGKLLAVCYNGDAYLIRDTNGDGLPDTAELFWENKGRLISPIGIALTPPGYKHGDGFFVASKGKCSLIVDTDGDGKADREIVVAEGWKQLPHSVDSLGVAFDQRDGNVYFGLGTTDYTNAYQVDQSGKAKYSLTSERGTIMRVSPDFQSREIVCTGIRFPVGLAFNRFGDLFSTDQEGATWLPNGNPLDELLHIQKGRHYGFPPRHPKHLPNVIDEPSTFDYGPQHQSTCGLFFNEPVNGGRTFGPPSWAGDAIVTGESRGKLFRTQLVKTPAGYIARNQLLACLNMLTVDACLTPDGGVIVACHSGKPDWGTGPTGRGKLYKITYTDPDSPHPTCIWPAGPREVRIAFDRPLDPDQLRNVTAQTNLAAGRFVRAGDRFESLFPPYQVVQAQLAAPRFNVAVRSVQLSAERRSLILATDSHLEPTHYALNMPRPGIVAPNGLRQVQQMDLDYDLCGVEANWKPMTGESQTIWLPHLDLDVARTLTAGSIEHDRFWLATTDRGGLLSLKTQLNLFNMLRPAIQPGARIDYEWPAEEVTLNFQSSGEILIVDPLRSPGKPSSQITVRPQQGRPMAVELLVVGKDGPPNLSISYHTNEDSRPRPLPLHRMLVPWAPTKPDAFEATTALPPPRELEGGSWARGRHIFFDDAIGCAKCHTVNGQGSAIGPDLSNLIHRDYASVLRDVVEPSAAINPDFVTYSMQLTDGRTLVGTIRTEGDKRHIGDQQGKTTTISKHDLERAQPTIQSTMPDDLHKQLGPDRLRDVLTFLMTEPRMPVYHRSTPPPPRSRAEVQAVLAGAPPVNGPLKALNIVLVAGLKDHGLGEHDYPAWQKVWAELLGAASQVQITTANEWPTQEQFRKADVMIFYQRGNWTSQRARDIDEYQARGGGLVYLHFAVDGQSDAPGFAQRIGSVWNNRSQFRHGDLELDFRSAGQHPISRNFTKLKLVDESYWQLTGDISKATILATGLEEQQPQPLVWGLEKGPSRVFVSIPAHYSWTFDDPLFRVLLLRGIAWAAKEPVDRFNELVWPGARVSD